MTPRRVLYIDLAPTPGGSVVSLWYLIRHLDRRRYEPVILLAQGNPYVTRFQHLEVSVYTLTTQQGQGVSFGPRVDRIRRGRFGAWIRQHPRLARIWHAGGNIGRWYRRFWPEARRIRRVIDEVRPDIIHLNAELVVNRPAALAARWTGRPTLCHVRGWEQWDLWDRWLARSVRAFVCISQAVARCLQAQGLRDTAIYVVYNGVDMEEIPTEAEPELFRALGLDPQRPRIGMFGRLTEWKGHQVFLHALTQVTAAIPDVQVIVVGGEEVADRGYQQALQALARRLGSAEQVRFLGHREDALRLYALVDVLVHASLRDEPFGRVIVEGMAAGRPVVATRGGGPVEIVRHGETGYLVPQGDPNALANAIVELLRHPERARRMGAAARADVARRFQARDTARHIMDIYETVFGG